MGEDCTRIVLGPRIVLTCSPVAKAGVAASRTLRARCSWRANLGFQEHLPENVRLGSASRLDFRMSCYKNNSLEALQSLESIDKYAIGHGDIGHRVAKNPVKMTRVSVLIFHELRTDD